MPVLQYISLSNISDETKVHLMSFYDQFSFGIHGHALVNRFDVHYARMKLEKMHRQFLHLSADKLFNLEKNKGSKQSYAWNPQNTKRHWYEMRAVSENSKGANALQGFLWGREISFQWTDYYGPVVDKKPSSGHTSHRWRSDSFLCCNFLARYFDEKDLGEAARMLAKHL